MIYKSVRSGDLCILIISIKDLFDLLSHNSEFLCNDVLDDGGVHAEVFMNQDVSQPDHLMPFDAGSFPFYIIR